MGTYDRRVLALLIEEAHDWLDRGDTGAASATLDEPDGLDADDPQLRTVRAQLALEAGALDDALTHAQVVLAREPSAADTDAWGGTGSTSASGPPSVSNPSGGPGPGSGPSSDSDRDPSTGSGPGSDSDPTSDSDTATTGEPPVSVPLLDRLGVVDVEVGAGVTAGAATGGSGAQGMPSRRTGSGVSTRRAASSKVRSILRARRPGESATIPCVHTATVTSRGPGSTTPEARRSTWRGRSPAPHAEVESLREPA